LPPSKSSWSESDLTELLGQSESIRREFKSGRMFDNGPDAKWITTISIEVSAFANTEGGELFLGIDEDRKSKPRVATSIDGVPDGIAPERLQQLIEGNLSPHLPGIRVHRVRLSTQPAKAVFVLWIPQGSTAYQANDGRYYGRSEFETKHLPDHEVRLRMNRGKVARGIILAQVPSVDLGAARESRARAEAYAKRAEFDGKTKEPIELEVEYVAPDGTRVFYDPNKVLALLAAQSLPDQVTLNFVFRNDGELTIRAPAIEFRLTSNERLRDQDLAKVTRSVPNRLMLEDITLYPGDEQAISGQFAVECKREAVLSVGDFSMSWKVFLDNSPPSYGEIDLVTLIETARRQAGLNS
jgi:hypothetical protein